MRWLFGAREPVSSGIEVSLPEEAFVDADFSVSEPVVVQGVSVDGEVHAVDVIGPGSCRRRYRLSGCRTLRILGIDHSDADLSNVVLKACAYRPREILDPRPLNVVPAAEYDPHRVGIAEQVLREMRKYGLGPFAETEDNSPNDDEDWAFEDDEQDFPARTPYMELEDIDFYSGRPVGRPERSSEDPEAPSAPSGTGGPPADKPPSQRAPEPVLDPSEAAE